MSAWLTILGVGHDGVVALPEARRVLIDQAEIIVGPDRLLNDLPRVAAEVHGWTSPIHAMLDRVAEWRGRRVLVLATGDPMHFGVGATLAKRFGVDEMRVLPSPSAFSLAAARLGWALQDVEQISLHGRPVETVQAYIQPDTRILALTEGGDTVRAVAALLVARGFGASRLTVLEHMDGPAERVLSFTAAGGTQANLSPFLTLAIECVAGPKAQVLPRVPGLPDDSFMHDGQLTKREVRAVTVAALGPTPGALLWDVGAGCGSVSIEWMRAARGARAIAFERAPERLAMIADNAAALGTPGLAVVAGDVPGTLQDQPMPSAIFVGGAIAGSGVVERCWDALPAGGRLVANAVTLEGEAAVIGYQDRLGGDLVRMDVSHLTAVGGKRALRPRMAVTQWRAEKP